ncbi:MAG: LysE family transporter [Anaerolineales bacterium]
MLLSFFLQGAGLGLSAAISPGPYQSLVIAQSLLGGWRRAAPVVFGPLFADPFIAFLLVFAVSQVPDEFLRLVKFGGAALLIFLAWGIWNEIRQNSEARKASVLPTQSPIRGVVQGALMIFLSPGSYLYWGLVLGPLLLQALEQSWLHAVLFVLAFYFCSIGGLLVIAFVISRVGQLSPQARRAMQIISLLLMLVIAVLLTYNGLLS